MAGCHSGALAPAVSAMQSGESRQTARKKRPYFRMESVKPHIGEVAGKRFRHRPETVFADIWTRTTILRRILFIRRRSILDSRLTGSTADELRTGPPANETRTTSRAEPKRGLDRGALHQLSAAAGDQRLG